MQIRVLIHPTFERSLESNPNVVTVLTGRTLKFWLRVTVKGEQVPPSLTLRNIRIFTQGYEQTLGEARVTDLRGGEAKVGPFTVRIPSPGVSWLECQVDAGGGYSVETEQLQADGSTGRGWSERSPHSQWRGPVFARDSLVALQLTQNRVIIGLGILGVIIAILGVIIGAWTLWSTLQPPK